MVAIQGLNGGNLRPHSWHTQTLTGGTKIHTRWNPSRPQRWHTHKQETAAVRTRGRRSSSWRAAPRPLAPFKGGTQAANHHHHGHEAAQPVQHTAGGAQAALPQQKTTQHTVHTLHKGSSDAAVTSGNTATTSGKRPHYTQGGRRKSR
uniref:(northern house mosquito) hypothetical protein n=1 Tax=Culex pipiens TaxID=7175 RepID=A0A8D8JSX4_CULPI